MVTAAPGRMIAAAVGVAPGVGFADDVAVVEDVDAGDEEEGLLTALREWAVATAVVADDE